MNIDDTLNEFMRQVGLRPTIHFWRWHGQPGFTSQEATVPKPLDWSIGYIIHSTSDQACLASQSEYVRECKAWLNNNKVSMREWSAGLANYSHAVMNFIHQMRPRTVADYQFAPPCTCDIKLLFDQGCQCMYSQWKRSRSS